MCCFSSILLFATAQIALMPGGDHLNIIDPPGLTVMRIAGGRYRVTAAHRVVWTWMNEFAALTDPYTAAAHSAAAAASYRQRNHDDDGDYDDDDDVAHTIPVNSNDATVNTLHVGDLVTMTIVDVFETDSSGKLLSYCPTFDNRAISKTHPTTETLRKGGTQLMSLLGKAQNSKTATSLVKQAKSVTNILRQRVDAAVSNMSQAESRGSKSVVQDLVHQAESLFLTRTGSQGNHSAKEAGGEDSTNPLSLSYTDTEDTRISGEYSYTADSATSGPSVPAAQAPRSVAATSTYLADDDSERHEV
jgi:hypothetical protein